LFYFIYFIVLYLFIFLTFLWRFVFLYFIRKMIKGYLFSLNHLLLLQKVSKHFCCIFTSDSIFMTFSLSLQHVPFSKYISSHSHGRQQNSRSDHCIVMFPEHRCSNPQNLTSSFVAFWCGHIFKSINTMIDLLRFMKYITAETSIAVFTRWPSHFIRMYKTTC
jgi:hypothetical protein